MGFEADEEILQDFLVEAGEILEQLSEQLIDLEKSPDDRDLLNSIFRGFHTVKGGAGFLQLNALVDCCHAAENVFDTLRNGHRTIDAELMDAVLKALDSVNDMFTQVSSGAAPEPADPELVELLHQYAAPQVPGEQIGSTGAEHHAPSAAETAGPAPAAGDDITDDEFEALLDALEAGKSVTEATPPSADNDAAPASANRGSDEEISDDEFEALLDQLHGKGKFNADGTAVSAEAASSNQEPEAPATPAVPEPATAATSNNNEISDDEFEALLDQLHGKGQFKVEAVPNAAEPVDNKAEETSPPTSKPDTPEPVNVKPADSKPAQAEPAAKPATPAAAAKPEPARAAKAEPASAAPDRANAQDTTVRVDTKRLDD
ncbi:MAG: Hpt domain-containing protein, partial [Pseudohongiellaceae bacterium]